MDHKIVTYTCKKIVKEGMPILHAYRDFDGDFQFFATDTVDLESAFLVSLQQILEFDPSLNELIDLEPGFEAHRENKNSKWIISKSDN